MPPFPGNKQELGALAAYIKHLQQTGETLEGAQVAGIQVNPQHSARAIAKMVEELNTKKEEKQLMTQN
jgi:hypothetical protein